MPILLFLAFVVVPIAELYVLIQVGQLIGVLPTIALLLVDSVVGAWLLRREGTKAWQSFRRALDEKRLPAREVADGALVIFGGALLLTPGFLTDILGLLCILPPSRAVLRRVLTSLVASRLGPVGMAAGMAARGVRRRRGPVRPPGPQARGTSYDIVDGEVLPPAPEQPKGPPPAGERPFS